MAVPYLTLRRLLTCICLSPLLSWSESASVFILTTRFKKFWMTGPGCAALLLLLAPGSMAVWPPVTSLEEEAGPPPSSSEGAGQTGYPVPPRPRGIADRLDADERRLDKALKDLEADVKELKQASRRPSPEDPPAGEPR